MSLRRVWLFTGLFSLNFVQYGCSDAGEKVVEATPVDGKDPDRQSSSKEKPAPADTGRVITQFPSSAEPGSAIISLRIPGLYDFDLSTVEAYVVGFENTLTAEISTESRVFVKGVPAGEHQVLFYGVSKTDRNSVLSYISSKIRTTSGAISRHDLSDDLRSFLENTRGRSPREVLVRDNTQGQPVSSTVRIPGTKISSDSDSGAHSIARFPGGFYDVEVLGKESGKSLRKGVFRAAGAIGVPEIVWLSDYPGDVGAVEFDNGRGSTPSRSSRVVVSLPPQIEKNLPWREMKVSKDQNFDDEKWENIRTVIPWSFYGRGTHFVYIKFRNSDLKESDTYATVIAYEPFVEAHGIALAGGSARTRTKAYDLSITAPPNSNKMRVWDENGGFDTGWMDVVSSVSTSSVAEGDRRFFVQFRDAEHPDILSDRKSAQIEFRAFKEAEIGVVVNSGAASTRSSLITASLTYPSNATHVLISETSSFSGASWVPVSASLGLGFTAEGVRTVFAKFRDADGFESPIVSDSIAFDAFPDSGGSELAIGVAFPELPFNALDWRSVPLQLWFPSNASEMQISNRQDFAGAAWLPISQTHVHQVAIPTPLLSQNSSRTESYTVYLRVRDAHGFVSRYSAARGFSIHRVADVTRDEERLFVREVSGLLRLGTAEILRDVVEASVSRTWACALVDGATRGARCLGMNLFGNLGNGSSLSPGATLDFSSTWSPIWISQHTPVSVAGSEAFRTLRVGGYHACAVDAQGDVYCWGSNVSGQLGLGSTLSSPPTTNNVTDYSAVPLRVSGVSGVVQLELGSESTCALTSSGKLFCWGANNYGQLGIGSSESVVRVPTEVTFGSDPVMMIGRTTFDGRSFCSLHQSNKVRCWGFNESYQVGDGANVNRNSPVEVTGINLPGSRIEYLSGHCAWNGAGTVCWGRPGTGSPLGTPASVGVAKGLSPGVLLDPESGTRQLLGGTSLGSSYYP